MNSTIQKYLLAVPFMLAVISLLFISSNAFSTTAKNSHEEDEQAISFSQAQVELANFSVAKVTLKYREQRLYAPGEVKANGYTSYLVSPRVESVILRRHAILGEHVKQGQALVSLFSEAVAEAQANYRIAYADWKRAENVGKNIISDSELLNAKTNYIATFSRLRAYGLSKMAIEAVGTNKDSALGEYTLVAERGGSVLSDDFQQGQRVSAGDTIMELSDETELWIEARLAANNQIDLKEGNRAEIVFGVGNEEQLFTAEVIQQGHTIEVETRTRVIRLKVSNPDHSLHPGLFVDVYFSITPQTTVMAVPQSALILGEDGDWLLYVQSTNEEHEHDALEINNHDESISFRPQEVELGGEYRVWVEEGKTWQTWQEVKGLASDSQVVMTGAFFIASQSAKAGFDTHNH